MGTISDKLDYLAETKTAIKNAIIAKGQTVSDNDTFRSYAQKIAAISVGGFTDDIKTALINLLEHVVFTDGDGEEYITALEEAIDDADPSVKYRIVSNLTHATLDNSARYVHENDEYIAHVTPESGYRIYSVTVTMGGVDVTSTVYSNNTIDIQSVTDDVNISVICTDNAVDIFNVYSGNLSSYYLGYESTAVGRGVCNPILFRFEAGKQYKISLGDLKNTFKFGVQAFDTSVDVSALDLTIVEGTNKTIIPSGQYTRVLDAGWQVNDYTFTCLETYKLVGINFGRMSGSANFTSEEKEAIKNALSIKEVN